jgi:hypothetical protein
MDNRPSEFTQASESEMYRRWSAFNLIVGISATIALIAGSVGWLYFAGESGSPQPDNWAQISRILGFIERSLLPLLAICIVAPFAWRASTRGKAWSIYPVPILLAIMLLILLL